MAKISVEIMDTIKRLANGSEKDQLKACEEYLCNEIFPNGVCVDSSVIGELLPFIVRCMDSKNIQLQLEGIFFTTVITTTSYGNLTTKYFNEKVIEVKAVEALLKLLLNSKTRDVLKKTFVCLDNIGIDHPKILHRKGKEFGIQKLRERCNGLKYPKTDSKNFIKRYIDVAVEDDETDYDEQEEEPVPIVESQKKQRIRKFPFSQSDKPARQSKISKTSVASPETSSNEKSIENDLDDDINGNNIDSPPRPSNSVHSGAVDIGDDETAENDEQQLHPLESSESDENALNDNSEMQKFDADTPSKLASPPIIQDQVKSEPPLEEPSFDENDE
uniref:Uncharacterized protein n=1 Tax=Panagrolaimus sp. ES5 TaxID=591445 RepID=A0AC34FJ88_9BILA